MAYLNLDPMNVENEQYCVNSMNKKNTDMMSREMGYHNMSDRANTRPWPVNMDGPKRNVQEMDPTNGEGYPGQRKT